jgi:hypothetical protein
MKKALIFLFALTLVTATSCKPFIITDVKIDSRFTYTSDRAAIIGILNDVIEVNSSYFDSKYELTGWLRSSMFEEDKEIGKWLKSKFGGSLRMGEAVRITYKYKTEQNGFDFVYKPYNKDIFLQNLITCDDFVQALEKVELNQ